MMDIDLEPEQSPSDTTRKKKKSALSKLAENRLKRRESYLDIENETGSANGNVESELSVIPRSINIDLATPEHLGQLPALKDVNLTSDITEKHVELENSDQGVSKATEDQFGSASSLNSLTGSKKKNPVLSRLKAKKDRSKLQMLDGNSDSGSEASASDSVDKTETSLSNQLNNIKSVIPPKARPRLLAPKLMSDVNSDVLAEANNESKIPSKGSVGIMSSDNTISRFRSLKVVNSAAGESGATSPLVGRFKPTPPSTPKGTPPGTPRTTPPGTPRTTPPGTPRGEKRIRDGQSSGEELDKESGRPRQRKHTAEREIEDKSAMPMSDYESGSSDEESHVTNQKTSQSANDEKLGQRKTNQVLSSEAAIQKKDTEMDMDLSQADLNTTQEHINSNYEKLLTTGSGVVTSSPLINRKWSIPERKKGLEPLTSVHPTPPLEKDFASPVLKTAYKRSNLGSIGSEGGTTKLGSPRKVGTLDSLDNRSLMSIGTMPLISTTKTRNRNFLVGNITTTGGLLGGDELDRHFPDRKLRLFVGTWNMEEKKGLPDDINDFLLPETSDDDSEKKESYVHDMYVIGCQELYEDRKEWEVLLQETLGSNHVLYHSSQHGSLHLSVFLRRELIWFLSVPEEDKVTTSPTFQVIKTKGCTAISFNMFGTSFLFINSHFAAHQDKTDKRIADYQKTKTILNLPKSVKVNEHTNNPDVTARFDCAFWIGDLNFRLNQTKDYVEGALQRIDEEEYQHYESLLVDDQLINLMHEGKVFHHFQEGRIMFAPTYKFDSDSDSYDSSKKQRIPSYTDRVLYRSKRKNGIQCLEYNSVPAIRYSDHRPVYCLFEVNLRPGRDNIPLAAGLFNREIYLEANRRRALARDVINKMRNQKTSSVCVVQ